MTFDEILATVQDDAVMIPDGWGQGRACFGGLVGAILYRRLRQAVPDRPVRNVMVSFVGPVAPGPATLSAEVLRSGKSVTQAMCRLEQDGATQAVMLVSFGLPRESEVSVVPPPAPAMKAPADTFPMPRVKGLVPDFTLNFDVHWAHGDVPYSRSQRGEIGGWIRFHTPRAQQDEEGVLALIDAWPPAVMPMYSRPGPSSSLTWSVEFRKPVVDSEWWQYQATTDAAADGYCNIEARFWDGEGDLVAISRQVVTIFV